MKYLTKSLILIAVIFALFSTGHAQTSKSPTKAEIVSYIKALVDSGTYGFQASYANTTGGSFAIPSTYDMKISKYDKVAAYLPYFGTAHNSTIDPSEIGIKFSWTAFIYTIKPGKKGNWTITIKPTDNRASDANNVRYVSLRISADGSASVQVTCAGRDPISFDGYIVDSSLVTAD